MAVDWLASLLAPYRGQSSDLPFASDSGDALSALFSSAVATSGRTPGVANFPATGDTSRWERVARRMAAQRGWTGPEWRAIDSIIERESGWNPAADNPTSSAIGIPQRLESAHPFSSAAERAQWLSSPRSQIRWLLNYIGNRYGNPLNALEQKNTAGWY